MKIGLDFDDTYTEDPEGWQKFVALMQGRGHTVTIVTFRPDDQDNADVHAAAELMEVPVVFTNGKQKMHCFDADVWIDDSPQMVVAYKYLRGTMVGCEAYGDTE